jgi:hypothetical protein
VSNGNGVTGGGGAGSAARTTQVAEKKTASNEAHETRNARRKTAFMRATLGATPSRVKQGRT